MIIMTTHDTLCAHRGIVGAHPSICRRASLCAQMRHMYDLCFTQRPRPQSLALYRLQDFSISAFKRCSVGVSDGLLVCAAP